jgi:hypothetical protein
MFYNAALDMNDRNGRPNKRLYSCIRFVADTCNPAIFYFNDEWARAEVSDAIAEVRGEFARKLGIDIERLLPSASASLRGPNDHSTRSVSPMPALVYLKEGAWETPADPETGARSGLVVPSRELVLSPSALVHKAHLRDSGLNAQTAILCLAAVGLDVMLPNLSFDLFADEEIERMKEDFRDERHQYLELSSKLAEQAYDGLKGGNFDDVLRWAEAEVAFKLAPKARLLEEAVSASATRQLRKAGYSFWSDGVPSIGAAYLGGGIAAAGIATGKVALKALVEAVGAGHSERKLPEVAYAMRIKRASLGVSD